MNPNVVTRVEPSKSKKDFVSCDDMTDEPKFWAGAGFFLLPGNDPSTEILASGLLDPSIPMLEKAKARGMTRAKLR